MPCIALVMPGIALVMPGIALVMPSIALSPLVALPPQTGHAPPGKRPWNCVHHYQGTGSPTKKERKSVVEGKSGGEQAEPGGGR